MTTVAPKDTRLVARVPQDVQEFVKNAADLSGATLSQFIVEAVTAKARAIIESEKNIRLTLAGAEAVFYALDNPPPINDALLSAAQRFKKQGGFKYASHGNTQS
jgi:uncharacterized protein (DUF1778 family)